MSFPHSPGSGNWGLTSACGGRGEAIGVRTAGVKAGQVAVSDDVGGRFRTRLRVSGYSSFV